MLERILGRSGTAEVVFRRAATAIGPLKKKIKRVIRGNSKTEIATEKNEIKIKSLKKRLRECGIHSGDIVLIHSSLDDLRSLGLTTEEILDLILEVYSEMTVVFAAYPIEPIKKKESYKYDPQKTLCWTGMLPNMFLKREGSVRSLFPYNSLAAKGKEAKAMMIDNIMADIPHGKGTAWDYCRLNHAKILFLGTTSREANTMAIHMVPDVMGDKWPIENWYEERKYIITNNGKKFEKVIKVQNGFWYQFVNEYKTDRLLKNNKLLIDLSFENVPLEIVPDCYEMIEYLIYQCENGKLMYSIPQKYYKRIDRRPAMEDIINIMVAQGGENE